MYTELYTLVSCQIFLSGDGEKLKRITICLKMHRAVIFADNIKYMRINVRKLRQFGPSDQLRLKYLVLHALLSSAGVVQCL